MRVDHRAAHVLVPKELLDCANVVAVFQQVGCERKPEGVFDDSGARMLFVEYSQCARAQSDFAGGAGTRRDSAENGSWN